MPGHLQIRANTAQKMKFSIKDFCSKCDQIPRKLRISSHLLKKSLMKKFIVPKNELGYKVVFVTRPTSPWGEIRFRVKLLLSIKKLLRVVTRSTWLFQQGLVMNNPENTFTLSPFSLFK